MASSSLRNAVKRRTHKERSQPEWNKKSGKLLEKHKDYVLRARDYNRKKDHLKKLQLKASFRNPDEFYFKMIKSKTRDGIHISTENHAHGGSSGAAFTAEEIKHLKSQDSSYLHMKHAIDRKKADKLQENLHFVSAEKANSHTIFVDSTEEVEAFDMESHFDTKLPEQAYNRIRNKTLKEAILPMASMPNKKGNQALGNNDAETTTELPRYRRVSTANAQYRELLSRLERADKLDNMRQRIEMQRKLQGKGKRTKIQEAQDGKPAVYRWRQQRLR